MDKKKRKLVLIGSGVILLLASVIFAPFGIIGLILLIVGIMTKVPTETVIKTPDPVVKSEPVVVEPVIVKTEPIDPEQFDKMKNMCIDIHKEYKDLLKNYTDGDIDRRVYILKECYRKLDVMETTIDKYDCYDDIDIFDEREKIEKKAKSFINAYIKEERDNGFEDYEIDVTQFCTDLDFIWDYINEKDEKLNNI